MSVGFTSHVTTKFPSGHFVQVPGSWHSNQWFRFECVHTHDTQHHDPACSLCTRMLYKPNHLILTSRHLICLTSM